MLAYQRTLGEQRIVVLCNLDGKKQTIQADGAWSGVKTLFKNYEGREMTDGQERYTLEPYEFMVLGNI